MGNRRPALNAMRQFVKRLKFVESEQIPVDERRFIAMAEEIIAELVEQLER
jgi:hypothetical protein